MRLDRGIVLIGLVMAGNAWFTIAVILFTSVVLWRWKKTRGHQLDDELEFEDEAVIINSPVAGEEQIPRMPGPGNQPPFQRAMRMLSTASSGPWDVSDVCQEEMLELTSLSPSNFRNPQGRTPISDSDNDESEQMSTAHVPGKHAPGEICTVCCPISQRYERQKFVLLANSPIRRGLSPPQLAPSSSISPSSSVHGKATLHLPPEGMGEANHTFSTFIVSPQIESIY